MRIRAIGAKGTRSTATVVHAHFRFDATLSDRFIVLAYFEGGLFARGSPGPVPRRRMIAELISWGPRFDSQACRLGGFFSQDTHHGRRNGPTRLLKAVRRDGRRETTAAFLCPASDRNKSIRRRDGAPCALRMIKDGRRRPSSTIQGACNRHWTWALLRMNVLHNVLSRVRAIGGNSKANVDVPNVLASRRRQRRKRPSTHMILELAREAAWRGHCRRRRPGPLRRPNRSHAGGAKLLL